MLFFCLFQLGVCTAADANPAAAIMWSKNGKLLVADGKSMSSRLVPPTAAQTVKQQSDNSL
jgi:hypothetical protein